MGARVVSFRPLLSAIAVVWGLNVACANPRGGQVVGGSATIQGQGTPGVVINQSSQSAIVNWQSFNIGPGESTRFVQPNAAAVALNRVTGDKNPSTILGTLSANGRVFLVNPEGFIFGPGAKINTAGFLATTHDIRNEDFLAGKYLFNIAGNPNASIVNQGTITVADTGIAALVAPAVRNDGIITARLGKIAMAAANGFSLDLYGDNLITFALNDAIASQVIDVATGKPVKALIDNKGKLSADGGVVAMTAVTARALVDSVINNSGVAEARSVGLHNGRIVLGAQTAKTKAAGSPTQRVVVSGTLDASGKERGQTGGTVQITGESIALAGASIDASGIAGGGKALIGGDTAGGANNPAIASIAKAAPEAYAIATASNASVDATTTINASALSNGNGGKVIVWSDETTAFAGTIIARGGSVGGNGGFVETSGHSSLAFSGTADVGATMGRKGTLLLDPTDVTIADSGTWIVTPSAIQTALASGDVIVNTGAAGTDAGDITVVQNVSWSNGSTLTLSANRDINVLSGVTIANTGAGSLVLRADNTGSGSGTVNFSGTGKVDFTGGTGTVSIMYNPASGYASPTNYAPFVSTNGAVAQQLTAYMLVNNVHDLQSISTNLAGTFAVGRDIDASGTAAWNGGLGFVPIGDGLSTFFNGVLDGQGHTIDGLAMHRPDMFLGLFGYIGSSGTVRNLNLANVSIFGSFTSGTLPFNPTVHQSYSNGGQFIGALAGQNNGSISTVNIAGAIGADSWGLVGGATGYNSGTIAGTHSSGSVSTSPLVLINGQVGGIVAENTGFVVESSSSASVSGVGLVGGLVADNAGGATINRSLASGAVSVYVFGYAGGLAGESNGSIIDSYAVGSVTALNSGAPGGGGCLGGLTCYNGSFIGSGAKIFSSYAAGAVSDGNGVFALGGLTTWAAGTATSSYWDIQATGVGTSGNGTAQTTAQLQGGLPSGFSSSVWGSNSTINGGYPYLLWQTAAPSSGSPTVLTGGYGVAPTVLYYLAALASDTYGHPLPSLTGTVTDTIGNPAPAGSTSGMLSFATSATSSSNIGTYSINGYGLTVIGNYVLQQAPSNLTALTISPAPLTITASNAAKPYGQALSFAGTEFSASGLLNGNTVTSVSLTSAGASATAPVAGNPYTISASNALGSGLGNYSISYVPGTLTVNPASLTITANDFTRQVGQPNPTFGATYSGFVLGQNPSIVSGLSLSTSATASSPAGNYAIVPSGASAPNYAINYVNGVLGVTAVPGATATAADFSSQLLWPAAQFGALSLDSSMRDSTPSVALPGIGLAALAGLKYKIGSTAEEIIAPGTLPNPYPASAAEANFLLPYATLARDVDLEQGATTANFEFTRVTSKDGVTLEWNDVMLASGVSADEVQRYANSGFFARIYQNNMGQVVVAFRSSVARSSDPKTKRWKDDWERTNYPELDGRTTDQYIAASVLARSVKTFLKPDSLVLTGFSKGGGQASYAGAIADRVITFDGARNPDSIGGGNSKQINVVVPGDPVGDPGANLPAGVGSLPGIYLSIRSTTGETHSIDGILGGLQSAARGGASH